MHPQSLLSPLLKEPMKQGRGEDGCSWAHSKVPSFSMRPSKVEAFNMDTFPCFPCGPGSQNLSPHRVVNGHPCISTTDWKSIGASDLPLEFWKGQLPGDSYGSHRSPVKPCTSWTVSASLLLDCPFSSLADPRPSPRCRLAPL